MGRKKRPKLEHVSQQRPATVQDVVDINNINNINQSVKIELSVPIHGDTASNTNTKTNTNTVQTIPTSDPLSKSLILPSPPPATQAETETEAEATTATKSVTFDPKISTTTTTKTTTTTTNTTKEKEASSSYGVHSHSGDLVEEDIYVSDGSDDEDWLQQQQQQQQQHNDANNNEGVKDSEMDDILKSSQNKDGVELILTGAKMGLMRRGFGLAAQLFQPKTWIRADASSSTNNNTTNTATDTDTNNMPTDNDNNANNENTNSTEQELSINERIINNANLTPAQKAAQLLAVKKQKEEELIQMKRTLESSENAGRDPCLFSKRTAFDIRMDQIEEKPWDRAAGGTADVTDYFNYEMQEEDWEEYSERQLTVRQELTDASRQRRMPDPTIVPVVAKAPAKQTPKVAVAVKKDKNVCIPCTPEEVIDNTITLGPTIPKELNQQIKCEEKNDALGTTDTITATAEDGNVKNDGGSGESIVSKQSSKSAEDGVWGIDVKPGSILAKLIEEQERKSAGGRGRSGVDAPPPIPPPSPMHGQSMQHYSNNNNNNYDQGGFNHQNNQYHHPPPPQHGGGGPPPPPPQFHISQFPPPQQHYPPRGFHNNNNNDMHGRGRGGQFSGGRGGREDQFSGGRGGHQYHQQQQHGQFDGGPPFQGRGNSFGGRGGRMGGRGGSWGGGRHFGGRGRGGGRGYMNNDWQRR